MSINDCLPTAECPSTGRRIIVQSGMWGREGPVGINCPACGNLHYWDARRRRLTNEPPESLTA